MDIKKIQIFGPFNSGTNLISLILDNCIDKNIIIDKQGHTLMWKHCIDVNCIERCINNHPKTLFICIYRPLQNWISSMKKKPYLIKCNNIDQKCVFKLPAPNGKTIKMIGSIKQPQNYNNIIEIYNKYYKNYIYLINKYDRVIFMNYYDFINKNKVEEYLKKKLLNFNLSLKKNHEIFSVLGQPAKENAVTCSEEALDKKEKCFNKINDNNKLIIKKNENAKIKNFFEE